MIFSKTCGGKSRVKQSLVSKIESSPEKARCTTTNILSSSMHLLLLKDSILKEKIEDRPVNAKVFYDYNGLVPFICKDSSRKLHLKFIASASTLIKVGTEGDTQMTCFGLNLTFYTRSTNFTTVA